MTRTMANTSVKIMCLIVVLNYVGSFLATDLYLPSFPAIKAAFATSETLAQMTLSIFLFSFAAGQLVFGFVSDKHGRRPVLLIGTVIYVFASLLLVYAKTIDWVLVARLLQGFGIGAAAALSRVIIRDLFKGTQLAKMMSYMGMIIGLTPALAPVLGGFIQQYIGYQGNFYLLLAYGVMMTVLIYKLMPETNLQKNPHAIKAVTIKKVVKRLAASNAFRVNVFVTSMAFSVVISYSTVNPFLFQKVLGLSAANFGLLTLLIAGGIFTGMLLSGRLVATLGMQRLVVLGASLIVVGSALMLVLAALGYLNVAVVVVPTLLAVVGVGMIFPNAAAGAFMPFPDIAGSLGSIYGFTQIIVSSVVGSIVSLAHVQDQVHLGFIMLALGLAGLIVSLKLLSPKHAQCMASLS